MPEIVINKEFTNPPEKLPVYKVDNPTINEKTVAVFAEKFGISGSVTFDVFTNTYQVAGKVHVSKTTGDFWITLEDPWNQPPPKNLPNESICKEIATLYLKEKGLLPKDAYFWSCGGSSNQNLTSDGLVSEKTVV